MAEIAWSTSTPGDDSLASAVDNQVRSDLTAIQTGLQAFLWWDDGSANSDGYFKAGTMRVANTARSAGTSSCLSDLYSDGWMRFDTRQAVQNDPAAATVGAQGGGLYLWNASSEDTRPILVGHPMMSFMSTTPSTVSATWVRSTGTTTLTLYGNYLQTSVITFGVTYAQPPYVHVCWTDRINNWSSTDTVSFGVDQISTQTARFVAFNKSALGPLGYFDISSGVLQWLSEGTVVYG